MAELCSGSNGRHGHKGAYKRRKRQPVVEPGLTPPAETTMLEGKTAAEMLASGTAGEEIQAVNVDELEVKADAVRSCKADRMFGRADPSANAKTLLTPITKCQNAH